MLGAFIERLMGAEVDAMCGAGYGERSPERVNSRNGYRHRDFDTRVGTLDLAVPKLREGSYFPGWLLEPRRRAERALTQVVCQCYVEGVSTRRVDDVVNMLRCAAGPDGQEQCAPSRRPLSGPANSHATRTSTAGPGRRLRPVATRWHIGASRGPTMSRRPRPAYPLAGRRRGRRRPGR